jgi:hypothetical protein
MFKRTNGYILLTLLVLTGFAGRVTNETLNSKERRFLITNLKESRADFLNTISGLSARQLDYRSGEQKPTIREYLHHIAQADASLSALAGKAFKTPDMQNRPPKINDAELSEHLLQECPVPLYPNGESITGNTEKEVLDYFKETRSKAIKYIRTTTQDVRAYTILTPVGHADPYQLYLGMCTHLDRHTREIKKLIASPGFPKK